MYKVFSILLLGLSLTFFSGCSSVQVRRERQLSRAAYAIDSSIKANRFDLVKSYSNQLVKLVDPIKESDKVKVTSFHIDTTVNKVSTSQDFTVLPAGISSNVIVIDSPEYKSILDNNKNLQEQVAAEQSKLTQFQSQTNKILVDQAAALQKANSQSWFSKLFSKFKLWTGLGLIGTILVLVGIGVLCAVFPPLIPIVLDILSLLWGIVTKIVGLVLVELENIIIVIKTHLAKK